MILGYTEIRRRIEEEKLLEGADLNNVNAASVDLRLGNEGLVEMPRARQETIDLQAKEPVAYLPVDLVSGRSIGPGEILICSTIEVFNLPNDLAAEFRLKSSASRNGLNLCLALHCDPGWHGSVLTFTLINQLHSHSLKVCAGMKIGQVVFREVRGEVPAEQSYAVKGQYNNDASVTASKGIR